MSQHQGLTRSRRPCGRRHERMFPQRVRSSRAVRRRRQRRLAQSEVALKAALIERWWELVRSKSDLAEFSVDLGKHIAEDRPYLDPIS